MIILLIVVLPKRALSLSFVSNTIDPLKIKSMKSFLSLSKKLKSFTKEQCLCLLGKKPKKIATELVVSLEIKDERNWESLLRGFVFVKATHQKSQVPKE